MKVEPITLIRNLLVSIGKSSNALLTPLPPSGSDRKYYHIQFEKDDQPDLIAFYNPIVDENKAQIEFTRHFRSMGMHVPDIVAYDDAKTVFILEYLGNKSLFESLSESDNEEQTVAFYKRAISDLVRFQVEGVKGLDFTKAYPVADFDRQGIIWDLNYFKYCFLKPAGIAFHEGQLEKEFLTFSDTLSVSNPNFFCYRDFQSRNIMVHDNKLWYIDFQGGRRGPLPYDLVSLLHQVKANLSEEMKELLFSHYLTELAKVAPEEVSQVTYHYNHFVYFRMMQVLGAYGFRGLTERKAHFLQSLPMAGKALGLLLKKHPLDLALPELNRIFNEIVKKYSEEFQEQTKILTVSVSSFSYKKKGPPGDFSGNGGGFVFDCRALPNPHRLPQLRDLTGEDSAIHHYLSEQPETRTFLNYVNSIIDASVENYQERGFMHLQVNFGCTGGRHRSVYCAVKHAEHLKKKYPDLIVKLNHLEIKGHYDR